MKTKEKIVLASLALFNEQGERNITTNHIAAHLGISPGNLYYHFRNKEDIIHSILEQYATFLEQSVHPVVSGALSLPPLQRLSHYLDAVFRVLWEYRFLYDNLPDLLSRAQALRQQYLAAQATMSHQLEAIIRTLADSGLITLQADEEKALVRTLRVVLSCWISYKKIMLGEQPLLWRHLYQGLLQVLMVVKPYITDAGRPSWQALQERYTQLATTTN